MNDEFEDEYERDEVEKVEPKIKLDHGGKRANSGRKAGTPNKATAAIKELASEYSARALDRLVDMMESPSTPPAAVVAACREILDRAHGKPTVAIEKTEVNDFPIPSISEIWPHLTTGTFPQPKPETEN